MDPVWIPVILFGGLFSWLIALAASRAYTAKVQAQRPAAPAAGPGQEQVLAALEDVRREVAELAERVDFAERLLAKSRGADRLGPPP